MQVYMQCTRSSTQRQLHTQVYTRKLYMQVYMRCTRSSTQRQLHTQRHTKAAAHAGVHAVYTQPHIRRLHVQLHTHPSQEVPTPASPFPSSRVHHHLTGLLGILLSAHCVITQRRGRALSLAGFRAPPAPTWWAARTGQALWSRGCLSEGLQAGLPGAGVVGRTRPGCKGVQGTG